MQNHLNITITETQVHELDTLVGKKIGGHHYFTILSCPHSWSKRVHHAYPVHGIASLFESHTKFTLKWTFKHACSIMYRCKSRCLHIDANQDVYTWIKCLLGAWVHWSFINCWNIKSPNPISNTMTTYYST